MLRLLPALIILQMCSVHALRGHSIKRMMTSSSKSALHLLDNGDASMGIDVSSLLIPQSSSSLVPSGDFVNDIQNGALLVGGIAYIIYEKRPRGDNARLDLLEVKPSTIKGANLGVFTKTFIPKGTLIGTFPGYIRTVDDALALKADDKSRERAKKYMWTLEDGAKVVDPTNRYGNLELELNYFFGIAKVNTILARVNEPPRGSDVNVFTTLTSNGVDVVTEKDLIAGEELFIDYGPVYDRSDYSGGDIGNAQVPSDLAKKREEEEAFRLQSVVRTRGDASEVIDQDTSRKGGFISKLRDKDGGKYRGSNGILSPDEGENLFSDMGAGMFGSQEDRELLESLMGKKKDSGKAAAARPLEERQREAEEELAKIFEVLEQEAGANKKGAATAATNPSPKGFATPRAPVAPPAAAPLITPEDALELQSRLDNLSDEQVEAVFTKMKGALGSRLKEKLSSSMEKSRSTADPALRKKYGSELSSIEGEIDKILSNPLDVWNELMRAPERYMGGDADVEEDMKKLTDEEMQ